MKELEKLIEEKGSWSMLSKNHKEELLIVTRQIKDHGVCVLGIGMPIRGSPGKKSTPQGRVTDGVRHVDSSRGVAGQWPCHLHADLRHRLFSVCTTITYAGYLDKAFLRRADR